jgi:hypothetical protein
MISTVKMINQSTITDTDTDDGWTTVTKRSISITNTISTDTNTDVDTITDGWYKAPIIKKNIKNETKTSFSGTKVTEPVRICKFHVYGKCRSIRNCNNGLHLSEYERNTNNLVSICFAFVNAPYTHSIQECVEKNNGLCEYCAYGNCSKRNECIYRHDANIRYLNDSKTKEYERRNEEKKLTNMYTVCNKWFNGIWCNGFCYMQQPKQCSE